MIKHAIDKWNSLKEKDVWIHLILFNGQFKFSKKNTTIQLHDECIDIMTETDEKDGKLFKHYYIDLDDVLRVCLSYYEVRVE